MKTSIFIPLAFEYDPDKLDSLQEAFGVTNLELLTFMRTVYEWIHKSEEEDQSFVQKTLVPMIQSGEVSPKLLLFFASQGALTMWEDMSDGVALMMRAHEESGDSAE